MRAARARSATPKRPKYIRDELFKGYIWVLDDVRARAASFLHCQVRGQNRPLWLQQVVFYTNYCTSCNKFDHVTCQPVLLVVLSDCRTDWPRLARGRRLPPTPTPDRERRAALLTASAGAGAGPWPRRGDSCPEAQNLQNL